jgi:hypothetical protein
MKNHPIYIKVKNYALANMTTVGFEAMTPGEIIIAAGSQAKVSGTFATNMKRAVLMALQARDDEARLQQLKSKVKTFLDANFPDWQAERGREGEKPYIKIWLKGKP